MTEADVEIILQRALEKHPGAKPQIKAVQSVLTEIEPLDEAQSPEAARLFNLTGRRRGLRIDALIAACATLKGVTHSLQAWENRLRESFIQPLWAVFFSETTASGLTGLSAKDGWWHS